MNPQEYASFLASFDEKRHTGLRVNTLKVSGEDFLAHFGARLSPIPWVEGAYYFEEGLSPGKHPYYHAGLYYIQEPSAMMPARALCAQPYERVLDLCAAPGGKTTQLGCMMQNTGLLVTNDISPKRVKALVKNVELMGLTNTLVVNESPERLKAVFPEYFDRILLDVPCSGEGMFRKDREAVQSYTQFKSSECIAMQRPIFEQAQSMLKPGGVLVYSTCTYNPDENERNIEYFSQNYGFEPVKLNPDWGWESSRAEWTHSKNEIYSYGLRLWPHKARGEGHFVAMLKKPGGNDSASNASVSQQNTFNSKECEKAVQALSAFLKDAMTKELTGAFYLRGSSLYLLPAGLKEVPALRWEKAGLYAGEYNKDRFEPSQSLVMASKASDFKRVFSLDARDQEVLRYLKGETLLVTGEKGYTGVLVDGFPLGWAKQEANTLKNLYPKGWRMM